METTPASSDQSLLGELEDYLDFFGSSAVSSSSSGNVNSDSMVNSTAVSSSNNSPMANNGPMVSSNVMNKGGNSGMGANNTMVPTSNMGNNSSMVPTSSMGANSPMVSTSNMGANSPMVSPSSMGSISTMGMSTSSMVATSTMGPMNTMASGNNMGMGNMGPNNNMVSTSSMGPNGNMGSGPLPPPYVSASPLSSPTKNNESLEPMKRKLDEMKRDETESPAPKMQGLLAQALMDKPKRPKNVINDQAPPNLVLGSKDLNEDRALMQRFQEICKRIDDPERRQEEIKRFVYENPAVLRILKSDKWQRQQMLRRNNANILNAANNNNVMKGNVVNGNMNSNMNNTMNSNLNNNMNNMKSNLNTNMNNNMNGTMNNMNSGMNGNSGPNVVVGGNMGFGVSEVGYSNGMYNGKMVMMESRGPIMMNEYNNQMGPQWMDNNNMMSGSKLVSAPTAKLPSNAYYDMNSEMGNNENWMNNFECYNEDNSDARLQSSHPNLMQQLQSPTAPPAYPFKMGRMANFNQFGGNNNFRPAQFDANFNRAPNMANIRGNGNNNFVVASSANGAMFEYNRHMGPNNFGMARPMRPPINRARFANMTNMNANMNNINANMNNMNVNMNNMNAVNTNNPGFAMPDPMRRMNENRFTQPRLPEYNEETNFSELNNEAETSQEWRSNLEFRRNLMQRLNTAVRDFDLAKEAEAEEADAFERAVSQEDYGYRLVHWLASVFTQRQQNDSNGQSDMSENNAETSNNMAPNSVPSATIANSPLQVPYRPKSGNGGLLAYTGPNSPGLPPPAAPADPDTSGPKRRCSGPKANSSSNNPHSVDSGIGSPARYSPKNSSNVNVAAFAAPAVAATPPPVSIDNDSAEKQ